MSNPAFLTTPQNRHIAYHQNPPSVAGQGPGVVFLGGFKSDMEGTKALHLEEWAKTQGRAFLRFDYSGHGQSSGRFLDGAIGDWFEDALAAITVLTTGPQILVGSSMGGGFPFWLPAPSLTALPALSALLQRRISPKTACGPTLPTRKRQSWPRGRWPCLQSMAQSHI